MVYSKEISTKITVDKLPKIIIIYSGYVKIAGVVELADTYV